MAVEIKSIKYAFSYIVKVDIKKKLRGYIKKIRSGNLTNVFCFSQNFSESTNSIDLVGVPPFGKENGLLSSTVKVCVIPVRFLQSYASRKNKGYRTCSKKCQEKVTTAGKDLCFNVKIWSQLL